MRDEEAAPNHPFPWTLSVFHNGYDDSTDCNNFDKNETFDRCTHAASCYGVLSCISHCTRSALQNISHKHCLLRFIALLYVISAEHVRTSTQSGQSSIFWLASCYVGIDRIYSHCTQRSACFCTANNESRRFLAANLSGIL